MRQWYHLTCAVCGQEFMAQSPAARYCGPLCRNAAKRKTAAEWKKRKDEWMTRRFLERLEEIRKDREKKRCNGCVWKTPGDHFCVMPTCLKDLGAVGERRKDEAD